jgi:hypothetical protein
MSDRYPIIVKTRSTQLAIAMVMALCWSTAWAWAQSGGAGGGATPAASGASAPAATTTTNPEPAYRACPSGYYLGPRPLRAWYTKDDYRWVVTPAFAAAFCMPPEFISTELSGAEAVAYKPVFEAVQRCVLKDAKPVCSQRLAHSLEIYYKTSLQLPAISDTRYNHVANTLLPSSMHLLAQQAQPSSQATQAWQASRPAAQRKFAGWQWLSAKGTQPLASIAPLREVQYIDEFISGHHYLSLETSAGKLADPGRDKPGSGRWVLVLDKPGHPRDGLAKDLRTGYGHVIELPQSLVAVIRAVDKEGEGAFKAFLRPPKIDPPPLAPAAHNP